MNSSKFRDVWKRVKTKLKVLYFIRLTILELCEQRKIELESDYIQNKRDQKVEIPITVNIVGPLMINPSGKFKGI